LVREEELDDDAREEEEEEGWLKLELREARKASMFASIVLVSAINWSKDGRGWEEEEDDEEEEEEEMEESEDERGMGEEEATSVFGCSGWVVFRKDGIDEELEAGTESDEERR
jgi:hypothetical protein